MNKIIASLVLLILVSSCGKELNHQVATKSVETNQETQKDASVTKSSISTHSNSMDPDDDNSDFALDIAVHTGDPELEYITQPLRLRMSMSAGKEYFIAADRLRVRSSSSLTEDNILGLLELNDVVKVLNLNTGGNSSMVEVEIIKTDKNIDDSPTGKYFLSQKYLSNTKREVRTSNPSKYFMVQNIATERLRVYERNHNGGAHKMIFETEVVVGEHDKKDLSTNTVLGNFRISRWIKFYQDGAGNYPSWYHPSLPMPPGKDAGVTKWFKKKYMGKRGGSMRGAFGWYTAKITPRSYYQWTHGTIGWGKSSHKFVKRTKGFWANVFADPRSHGCTRTNNEAIAYLRQILPVSTPLVKIYAREDFADSSLSNYTGPQSKDWAYILTKEGARKNGPKSARDGVLARNVSYDQYLEEGIFNVDIFPTANDSNGKKANVYRIDDDSFKGRYYIDTGMVTSDYRHPRELKVGGYKDEFLPSYIIQN